MMFVKDFEVNKHGRNDQNDGIRGKDNNLYAWIAGDEDYNSNGIVGDYLRYNGDLKIVSKIEIATWLFCVLQNYVFFQ